MIPKFCKIQILLHESSRQKPVCTGKALVTLIERHEPIESIRDPWRVLLHKLNYQELNYSEMQIFNTCQGLDSRNPSTKCPRRKN